MYEKKFSATIKKMKPGDFTDFPISRTKYIRKERYRLMRDMNVKIRTEIKNDRLFVYIENNNLD